jgi:hypothetical protein
MKTTYLQKAHIPKKDAAKVKIVENIMLSKTHENHGTPKSPSFKGYKPKFCSLRAVLAGRLHPKSRRE